jgi:polysaccharide export outer membrane protein
MRVTQESEYNSYKWLTLFKTFDSVEKKNYLYLPIQLFVVLLVLNTSCSNRNLVYFSDLQGSSGNETPIRNYAQPVIHPDDILSISVSSLNPESNVLFNNVILPTSANSGQVIAATKVNEGYLVDKSGFINFPVIGKIMLAGLTKEQAIEKMTNEIKVHVKNPIVNIRFLNFKVTVIGEVNKPNTFTIDTEKINVLEALGLAGDMTAYGKRENVLIIREQQGVRRTTRINLNNKDVLNSPYFYLQQNDIVYVEPSNREKRAEISVGNRYIGLWSAFISTVGFVAITLINNNSSN